MAVVKSLGMQRYYSLHPLMSWLFFMASGDDRDVILSISNVILVTLHSTDDEDEDGQHASAEEEGE